MFSMFLMLTLYMQQVLGFSALKTGVGYLAVAGTAVIWANVAAVAVNRVGVKPALILGMSLLTVGLLYFTQVSVDGTYWADLFPGFLDPRGRDSVRVRPDHDRRAGGHEASGGRSRLRPDQHVAADRRRSRDRAALDDRGHHDRRRDRRRHRSGRSRSRTGSSTPSGRAPRSPSPASSSPSSWCAAAICEPQEQPALEPALEGA